jgi:hypothetical protein
MTVNYEAWSEQVTRLYHALSELRAATSDLAIAPPDGEEWFSLLEHKLLPQLRLQPRLVVAVVGGTNIGKSAVFNQLAGENASASGPLAAGTRHPVCLAPPNGDSSGDDGGHNSGGDGGEQLAQIFEGFTLRRWQSADDPLMPSDEHLLFWRVGEAVPPRLLLLDTPDIDSDAVVNWQRAEHVRQVADVLIAVLTQQKYNDAAVKRFFRKAAEADKSVIVVFNQCDLEHDAEHWPRWLATLTSETGIWPAQVYVIPYDRRAAQERRLAFYAVGPNAQLPLGEAASLREELARLHFDAIKVRAFRGAMARVLDLVAGAPAYLARVRHSAADFSAAAEALADSQVGRVHWPTLPARLVVEEIQCWWDDRRNPVPRKLHQVYRRVGQTVTWPVRRAWQARYPERDPLDSFRVREREVIVEAIERLLDELERLARLGNDVLRPRLQAILGGASRQALLARVTAAHAALPAVGDEYREYLRAELDRWSEGNPRAINVLRSLDQALAFARPAITLSLALGGWFLAGDVVGHAAAQVAGHTAGHLATEAAIAGGVTGGGEAVVSATGEGLKHAAARLFQRLQTHYAEMRAEWLGGWLERELLGAPIGELRRGAALVDSAPYRQAKDALLALGAMATGDT